MGERRKNNAGTLERRGKIWYTKIMVNGKKEMKSTGTEDKEKASEILDKLTVGYELSDKERLAVIKARLEGREASPTFEAAWNVYVSAPENVGQTEGARNDDAGRWRFLLRWLHGYDGGRRCRINCKAAHPNVKVLEDVTQAIATEFVNFAKATTSPNTLNKYIRTFKRVWTINNEEKNPWAAFRKFAETPHLRRALSNDEVKTLIGEADGELLKLFAIGAFTGLRMSDCAKLKWAEFDNAVSLLTVRPSKTVHTSGVSVAIPVHPTLKGILGKKGKGCVTPELAALSEDALSKRVCHHFSKCGFEAGEKLKGYRRAVANVGFHSLRATFITNMANIGAPMAMVQAIVGHMTPEMSMHYYRANAEAARARINAMPNFI